MIYPSDSGQWDKWIVDRRPAKSAVDAFTPHSFSVEKERSASGEIVNVATVFLTNKECPWRCLMCDLWRNTLDEKVPLGAISKQIDYALDRLTPARQIKLYNSGSFFDRQAIPLEDYPTIAASAGRFEHVVVESHPSLLGENCLRFRDMLSGSLEVAMGLETAHPATLARLNKRMTLDQFEKAAEWLLKNEIALRTFILVKPPFMDEPMAQDWAVRSLDFAFQCRSSVSVLIPTRSGNGALDDLAAANLFSPPSMKTLETAAQYGLAEKQGRVFVDLWDLERISKCQSCYAPRKARLLEMNLFQENTPPIHCDECERTLCTTSR